MKNTSAGTLLLAQGPGGNSAQLGKAAAAVTVGAGGERREFAGGAWGSAAQPGHREVAFNNGVVSNVPVESHDMSGSKPEIQAGDGNVII